MSELKLFKIQNEKAHQLDGASVALERSLQTLIEQNLDTILGVRFLRSEHHTGPKHGGRIDTLGLDENHSPVIIEYKRASNENVINQGLFYLDWLMDHRAEFELLVMKTLGQEAATALDWTGPRLVCIAGDFTRYDTHAVQQINRNIDLIRYRRFGDDLLALELVHTVTTQNGAHQEPSVPTPGPAPKKSYDKPVTEALDDLDPPLHDLYEAVREHLLAMGDDVTEKVLKLYVAFRKIRNFVTIAVQKQALLLYLKLDPSTVELDATIMRDVRNIGHWGTGDLEITLASPEDFERIKPLLQRAYDEN